MPKHKLEYIITVMAQDRPGIVAGIGKAICELGGNIEELSQTVVRGYFTIIVCATFSNSPSCERVKESVAATGASGELEVAVRSRKSDEPLSAKPAEEQQMRQSEVERSKYTYDRFILTLFGQDRPGIVHHMASYLASHGINITDIHGRASEGVFTMVLELETPPELNPRRLKNDLERLGRSFGLSAHFQHENLFKATNDLRSLAMTSA